MVIPRRCFAVIDARNAKIGQNICRKQFNKTSSRRLELLFVNVKCLAHINTETFYVFRNCLFLSQDGGSQGHIKIGGSNFGLWTCVNYVLVIVVVVVVVVVAVVVVLMLSSLLKT